jgi:hypothetical protein
VRCRQALRFRRAGSTAPADAIERVARHANFHLHRAGPWHEAVVDDNRVRARAEDGTFEFDFVIAGTGYTVDLHARPELAGIAHHVLLWRDGYTPASGERDDALEYVEKRPGEASFLKNIHVVNAAGLVSRGEAAAPRCYR